MQTNDSKHKDHIANTNQNRGAEGTENPKPDANYVAECKFKETTSPSLPFGEKDNEKYTINTCFSL